MLYFLCFSFNQQITDTVAFQKSAAESRPELSDEGIEDYAWLAKIETPDDLYMRPGMYAGPAIQI